MKRNQSRQGFLVSAIVHMLILMALSGKITSTPARGPEVEPAPLSRQRVFLPPPSVLRELAQAERPRPVPPPPTSKDRISVGGPSDQRQERLQLRRDEKIEAPKGRPDSPPPALATPVPAASPMNARAGGPQSRDVVAPGLRLPQGPGAMPRGSEAEQRGSGGRSIASSLRDFDARLQQTEPPGIVSGTGSQTGPLQFDPQGADFTAWIERFRTEVYRNWIMPQPALMGIGGQVEIEFTVERDGRLSALHVTRTSGTPALDRAAANALGASRLLPLPSDYKAASVTMKVTFTYNVGPRGA